MKQIPLTQGKITLVSDQDYETMKVYIWHAVVKGNTWYAATFVYGKRKCVFMHELIMGVAPAGFEWDHKDQNGWNNQRENLRLATHAQNCANRKMQKNNTSGFRGVTWQSSNNTWQRTLWVNGVRYCKAGFATKEEAARSYDRLAKKHLGEFAQLNFPENVIPLEQKVA